eukprot:10029472-Ditylum_brightwellii.AAC.1
MESKAKYMGGKIFKKFTIVTSCSDDPAKYHQQGGREQQQVTVVTAYRPCIQHNPGNTTVTAQQIRVMQQNGVIKPKPCTAWIKDIKRHIDEWKQEGEVIILVDANSGLDDKGFAPLIAEIGLCDIIR